MKTKEKEILANHYNPDIAMIAWDVAANLSRKPTQERGEE